MIFHYMFDAKFQFSILLALFAQIANTMILLYLFLLKILGKTLKSSIFPKYLCNKAYPIKK